MNQRVVGIIIIFLSLVLLGIFGVYFLISRQIVTAPVPTVADQTTEDIPTPIVFPPIETKNIIPISTSTTIAATEATTTAPVALDPEAALATVTTEPVVSIFRLGTGTSSLVAYAARADGHLFTINSQGEINLLSNTTVPKTIAVRGGRSASTTSFVFQTSENQSSQWLRASLSSDPLTLLPLSATIRDLLPSPNQQQLMAIESTTEGTVLRQGGWQGTMDPGFLSLPLKELAVSWPHPNLVLIQTKPSATAPGSVYLYDLRTKRLELLMNKVPGLSASLSSDGRFVAYSGLSNGNLFSGLYDRQTKAVTRLPFITLAEKCAWGSLTTTLYCAVPDKLPSATYPDNWYQGTATTTDRFWQLDAETKQAKTLYAPTNEEIDAFNLITDAKETKLFFINKADLKLWVLDLNH